MKRGNAAILATILSLAGCATQYGSQGFTGGHTDKRLNDRVTKVDFSGNAYITADKIQTYGLYRCAEIARDAKKPYFVIYDSLFSAALDAPTAKPRVGTLGGKPLAVAFLLLEDSPRAGSQKTSAVLAELDPIVHAEAQNEKGQP